MAKPLAKTKRNPAPKRPFGRSLSDFGRLSAAERKLLEACRVGEFAVLGTGHRPDQQTPENTVRPGLIRFLALGGDEQAPAHEKGVQLKGAWINGTLDLEGCHCPIPLWVHACTITEAVTLRNARMSVLSLQGSSLQSLQGDRLQTTGGLFLNDGFKAKGTVRLLGAQIGGNFECRKGSFEPKAGAALAFDGAVITGSVFLNNGFKATGEVQLLGAQIGGDLACKTGSFEPKVGDALSCDGAVVKGSVFLNDGFKASGEVRLLGAQIGGNFECSKGSFENNAGDALACDGAVIKGSVFLREGFKSTGTVRLHAAQIGGNLSCDKGSFETKAGHALICDGAVIKGGLFFRNVAKVHGSVSFAAAEVGSLADDSASWAMASLLNLDGFRYGRIVNGPTDAARRIAWLVKQRESHLKQEFRPQPWEQLIKVLREMGHESEARTIAIAKQDALRKAGKFRGFARLLHGLYGGLAGYGYRPTNTMLAMLMVWLTCGVVYQGAGDFGLMGPSSPIVLTNADIRNACGKPSQDRQTQWTMCPDLPKEYTTFSPYIYSLDLILPLVSLQQDSDWAPIVTDDTSQWIKYSGSDWIWPGAIVRFVMWFEILFGWAMSLLLVAVLGNLVKKD